MCIESLFSSAQQSAGVQERVLRLKRGSKCEPVKIMRRECRIGKCVTNESTGMVYVS